MIATGIEIHTALIRRVAGIAEATDDNTDDAAAADGADDDDKVSLSPSTITDCEKFISHDVLLVGWRSASQRRMLLSLQVRHEKYTNQDCLLI